MDMRFINVTHWIPKQHLSIESNKDIVEYPGHSGQNVGQEEVFVDGHSSAL
jgi:hypothetical protein